MEIQDNRVVAIHYRLTTEDGQEIDASPQDEPLEYLHGHANLIPALERELTGHEPGDSVEVTLAPEDAYGEHDAELIQKVPNELFSGVEQVAPGMQFEASDQEGRTQRVFVRSVEDDGVTIDANHPLAGMNLKFDVEVGEVREATDAELTEGRVQS